MRVLLPIAVIVAVVMTGCTTDSTETVPSPAPSAPAASPSVPPSEVTTDPSQMWQRALEQTGGSDGAVVDVQLITDVEGFERITSGEGYVEMNQGYGDIVWTDELGTTREVLTADGHFLEVDGTWFAIESPGSLPTTVAFDPLRGLDAATNVVDAGGEVVFGVNTTRLDAQLDPSQGATSMGFSDEERTVFVDNDDASLTSTMWVDEQGRIVRLLRDYRSESVDGDPISATSLYVFTGVGVVQPIDVPETADAIPAPV